MYNVLCKILLDMMHYAADKVLTYRAEIAWPQAIAPCLGIATKTRLARGHDKALTETALSPPELPSRSGGH